ncbi:MAG TPA: hypothetical protein VMT23_01145 [Candidatus Binatia bacterium]|nr:hypothetical protein [Candidatus Binatia bacterium]
MFGNSDDQNNQPTPSLPVGPQPADYSTSAPPPSGMMSNPIAGPNPIASHPAFAPEPTSPAAAPTAGDGDLLDIKKEALQNLSPLVGQLDQSPEEKFKTTMMLIQASDNPALIKQAYEAAGQISDQNARAQALIDVVNEINYFTQNKTDKKPDA